MTAAEERLWLSFQRRASTLTPDMAAELLDAFRMIRAALSDEDLEELVRTGAVNQLIDDALVERSLRAFRAKVVQAIARGFQSTIPQLPNAGKLGGELAVGFDILNPKVIDAVRELDSRVINTVRDEIRDAVRAHVEDGIRDGVAHRTIARRIRPILGLAPNQAEAVENYRKALQGENPNAGPTDYKLRDRRFDKLAMTPERIDRAVNAYAQRMQGFHANTVAGTASKDSLKLGQRLTWDDAIARGIVAAEQLEKTWVTVGDDRVRPEHQKLHGEKVGFDATFSNGDTVPGESDWNCRCIARYTVKKAAV